MLAAEHLRMTEGLGRSIQWNGQIAAHGPADPK
jgi:hypothetical protein